ncbi:C-type lectin domain family 5 member A-like isoform X2 [Rhineura floridana]|uniref:C-type lectin domain family 5 member A-like isoform X2 n=1 Tax=Rhineura floridana TaxID=261503 RepID=UPI002AC8483F|nr:C-type lectin domain family 5 member A-like isoform X2 [Rhineura floridana]
MKWDCVVPLVVLLVIKLIGSSLFLLYFSQILFQEVPSKGITVCSTRWVPYDGKCYFFSALEKTWDESKKDCAQSNSHLAVVNSKTELMFLLNMTKSAEYFIGLTQRDPKGSWRWIDNTKFEPDLFNIQHKLFDCAVVGLDIVSSMSCSAANRWICEEKA